MSRVKSYAPAKLNSGRTHPLEKLPPLRPIGQSKLLDFLTRCRGFMLDSGRVVVNPETGQTTNPATSPAPTASTAAARWWTSSPRAPAPPGASSPGWKPQALQPIDLDLGLGSSVVLLRVRDYRYTGRAIMFLLRPTPRPPAREVTVMLSCPTATFSSRSADGTGFNYCPV